MSENSPKYTELLACGHCRNKSPMQIVASYSEVSTCDPGENHEPWDEGYVYELLKCPACKGVLLRNFYYHDFHLEDGLQPSVLYPTEIEKVNYLPSDIASAYEAANRVIAIDVNAYAVLIGRVLDKVCLDKKAKGENLYEKLQALADKSVIPPQLADMAHQLRQLRNIGAHADLGELTPSEVPILTDLCRAIIEYVYRAPSLIAQVQTRIDSLKKPR